MKTQYKKTAILIPARYESSRLVGKPLVSLAGIPMILRVARAATKSGYPVFVLTDNHLIANAVCHEFFVVNDSRNSYMNGTERCASVLENRYFDEYDFFINVQGDMPDVKAGIIHKIADRMQIHPYLSTSSVVTAYTNFKTDEERKNVNSAKAIVCKDEMQWCGRGFDYGHHHLGIYGYTRAALSYYPKAPSEYEKKEGLEQLRWLESGIPIGAVRVDFDGIEINTIDDVARWHKMNK